MSPFHVSCYNGVSAAGRLMRSSKNVFSDRVSLSVHLRYSIELSRNVYIYIYIYIYHVYIYIHISMHPILGLLSIALGVLKPLNISKSVQFC